MYFSHMLKKVVQRDDKVTFELSGGLGNQLFQYFAGLALSLESELNLVVDIRYCQNSHSRFDISSFNLPGKFLRDNSQHVNYIRKFVRRFNDSLIFRIAYYRRFVDSISQRSHWPDSQKFEVSSNLIKRNSKISGFFGSNEFLRHLIVKGCMPSISLLNPSHDFLELSKEAMSKKPIILHIRRGDFVQDQSIYGLLSESYYANALASIPIHLKGREVWVFSDDLSLISDWDLFKTVKVRFISNKDLKKNDPAEFLLLMSLGSVIVIANSTFSYFAAIFSGENSLIICPSPFMKGREVNLSCLYFDDWMTINSHWENNS